MSTPEKPHGGSSGLGFFLGFFAIIILLALVSGSGGVFKNGTGSMTGTTTLSKPTSATQGGGSTNTQTTISSPTPKPQAPTKRLSDAEIERKLAQLYRELDSLEVKLRAAKLREPASPSAGLAKIGIGSARETNPEREYVTIQATSKNKTNTNISHWYLQSLVTDESAAIPRGDRIIEKWRHPIETDIFLEPGESAYLMTGVSPLDVSFHENICTGYLARSITVYPSLSRSCPTPMNEMKKFGNIALDNDSCYDFVKRINQCSEPTEESIDAASLTGSCRRFVENNLSHDNCIINHRYDPFFDNVGTWHIYLERNEDLWRKEREIIRLMDENDRVIDVIEY